MRVIDKNPSDFIFLGIIALMVAMTIILLALSDYVLPLTTYAGIAAFSITVVLQFVEYKYRRYAIAILLALGSFNVLTFSVFKNTGGLQIGNISLTVNALFSLMTLIYAFINLEAIKRVFRGSDQVVQAKLDRQVNHYRNVFAKCSPDELKKMMADIHEYPEAAQIVLKEMTVPSAEKSS